MKDVVIYEQLRWCFSKDRESEGYVLGFFFTPDLNHVLLIKKTHPRAQSGLLNGIGGKIEPGEIAAQAMIREFNEETGYTGKEIYPIYKGFFEWGTTPVHVFCGTCSFEGCHSTTPEKLILCLARSPILGSLLVDKVAACISSCWWALDYGQALDNVPQTLYPLRYENPILETSKCN